MSTQEMKSVPVRTAQQIVDETEQLSVLLMKEVYQREPEEGILFHRSENVRAKHVWTLACKIQEMLTQTDPEDALSELDEDMPAAAVAPQDDTQGYLVVQEGGSSREMYVHGFDTIASADAYRESSVKEGAYRTSPPIQLPKSLLEHPEFFEVAESIAKGAVDVDYPEVTD